MYHAGRRYPIHSSYGRRVCPIHSDKPTQAYGQYWKLSIPPKGYDVLLPTSLSGQYRVRIEELFNIYS